MVGAGPPATVNSFPAARPKINLLRSAPVIVDPPGVGDRWNGGFAYLPDAQDAHGAFDDCAVANLTAGSMAAAVTVYPFIAWAADDCSTLGGVTRDWEGRATRLLEAATPWEIERELWEGAVSRSAGLGNKYLTGSTATNITPSGGAMAAVAALGCLENALGSGGYGGRGMIHATRALVTQWIANNLIERVGDLLLTKLDNIVVPGVGYTGSGLSVSTPVISSTSTATTGGTIPGNATYCYEVTALTALGETLPSAASCRTVPAGTNTNTVTVNWGAISGAIGYKIYGRPTTSGGVFGLIAAVGGVTTYIDTGAPAPGAAPPTAATAGAPVAPSAGETWAFATDLVAVRVSTPEVFNPAEGGYQGAVIAHTDRSVNRTTFRAERFAAATWDKRHYAIRAVVPTCGP